MPLIHSAKELAKELTRGFLAEGRYKRHLAKMETLSSITVALGKVFVTVTWRQDDNFSLSSVRQKVLSKEFIVDVQFVETSLLSGFEALPSASGTR